MAEQKTEDQKPPVARRGARPFAGPASAAQPARPFLRPGSSGGRPGPAAFARPVAPPSTALGNVPAATQAPAPAPVALVETTAAAALHVAATEAMPAIAETAPIVASDDESRAQSSTPSFDISFGRWGLATPAVPAPAQAEPPAAEVEARPAVPPICATDAEIDEVDLTEPLSPLRARPITSEVVALDAFDAFNTVWATTDVEVDHANAETSAPAFPASPLDGATLGSAGDAATLWADDIAAGTGRPDAAPAPLVHGRVTPELAMPAWLADDTDPVATPAPIAGAPMLPAVDESLGHEPDHDQPRAWNDITSAPDAHHPPAPAAPSEHEVTALRVSAALDRLAQRVRGGEIAISSVAPEATDAAVLASVLAALLGGSSSR